MSPRDRSSTERRPSQILASTRCLQARNTAWTLYVAASRRCGALHTHSTSVIPGSRSLGTNSASNWREFDSYNDLFQYSWPQILTRFSNVLNLYNVLTFQRIGRQVAVATAYGV